MRVVGHEQSRQNAHLQPKQRRGERHHEPFGQYKSPAPMSDRRRYSKWEGGRKGGPNSRTSTDSCPPIFGPSRKGLNNTIRLWQPDSAAPSAPSRQINRFRVATSARRTPLGWFDDTSRECLPRPPKFACLSRGARSKVDGTSTPRTCIIARATDYAGAHSVPVGAGHRTRSRPAAAFERRHPKAWLHPKNRPCPALPAHTGDTIDWDAEYGPNMRCPAARYVDGNTLQHRNRYTAQAITNAGVAETRV